jgi:hypothetical protein
VKFTPYPLGDELGRHVLNLDLRVETRKGGEKRLVLYPDAPDGWERGIPYPSDKATAVIRFYGTLEEGGS